MTVQANIAAKEKALVTLKDHCLCFRADGNIVYLPDGYSIDALRIDETADGYRRAAEYLEKIWQESMWWR